MTQPDMSSDLRHLTTKIIAFRDARSWRQFHTPKDLALALNIEAGELAELFLWKSEAEATALAQDPETHTALADELADVLIYALLLANHYNIDLGEAVEAKLAKNALKYPVEQARGNAKKYTEFDK